ncbi:MAG: DUF952 domain-containing protein [Cyanobacteria bacterium J06641_5]
MTTVLFHILRRVDWQQAQASGSYQPESLAREGFIHCSTPAQLVATANRFFRGQTDLVLLAIDRAIVTAEVRDDLVAAEGQTFPHIWGPLNLDAVVREYSFVTDIDGNFALPSDWEDL